MMSPSITLEAKRAARAKPARGASRKQVRAKRRASSGLPLKALKCLVIFVLAASSTYAIANIPWSDIDIARYKHNLKNKTDKPIGSVSIRGQFQFVSRMDVQALVVDTVSENSFMNIDLAEVKEKVEAHQWIRQASVERHWPDTLIIEVEEHSPIAQWGEQGYINRSGEIFLSEMKDDVNVPKLDFSQDYEPKFALRYVEITELLSGFDLSLHKLEVEESGLHKIYVSDAQSGRQYLIKVDDMDTLSLLNHYGQIYAQVLKHDKRAIKRVDLRHVSGMAIAWAEPAATTNGDLAHAQ